MKAMRHPLADIQISHIVKMVREAAALQPKRTAGCTYVKGLRHGNLKPRCLVGQALYALGVPLIWLADNNDAGIGELFSPYRDFNDDEQREMQWLSTVQLAQDNKSKWGKAVARADREWLNVDAD